MLGTTVALGLGSNLGNSLEYLRMALAAIRQLPHFTIQNVSSIFESDALTPDNAPVAWNKKYLNAVVLVHIEGDAKPLDWLKSLKKIETGLGRKSGEVWAPREIDIDILYWSRDSLQSPELKIPHARLIERPFALLPLLEVWPALRRQIQIPDWAQPWESSRPFNTKPSGKNWPRLVGILNVTPDSFSDGGQWLTPESIEQQLKRFAENDVEIVDIGAESTRPSAAEVSPQEELKRLEAAFEVLNHATSLKISLDCRRAEVAEQIVLKQRVDFLNDVTGFESAAMQKLLKESKKKAFVMHSLGVPPTKDNVLPQSKHPAFELNYWWNKKCEQLGGFGVETANLIFDPGIGFGKTAGQSLYLLSHLEDFSIVKNEIMIGHSRKSFQSAFSRRPAQNRDMETAIVTYKLNLAHVQYLRVHDPETQAIAMKARSFLC